MKQHAAFTRLGKLKAVVLPRTAGDRPASMIRKYFPLHLDYNPGLGMLLPSRPGTEGRLRLTKTRGGMRVCLDLAPEMRRA